MSRIKPRKSMILGISLLSILTLSACSSNNSSKKDEHSTTESTVIESSQPTETTTEETSEHSDASYDDATKTFTSKYGTLKFTNATKVTSYHDEPAVKIDFTVTSNMNKPVKVQELVQTMSIIQQKNGGSADNMDFTSLKTDNEMENGKLQSTIVENGSVDGYYVFKLKNDNEPLIIQFVDAYNFDSNGETIKTIEMPIK